MTEADLETDVVRLAKGLGGYALKLKIEAERGWGDRTLFLPEAKIAIAELKKPGKSDRSVNQRKWIRRLQQLGFAADFCETVDDVKRLLNL